jgi:hypothetical protein
VRALRKMYLVLSVVASVAILIGSLVLSFSYEPLDTVAERLNLTQQSILNSPFPEYTIPGLPDWLGGILSGLIGFIVVLIMVAVLLGGKRHGSGEKAQ